MTDESWYTYKRTPERSYIIRETTDRRYRYCVWYALQIPPSLRERYYSTLPAYLMDKVRDRVKTIEKLRKR